MVKASSEKPDECQITEVSSQNEEERVELIQVKLRVPRSAPGWAEVVSYLEEMVFNVGCGKKIFLVQLVNKAIFEKSVSFFPLFLILF